MQGIITSIDKLADKKTECYTVYMFEAPNFVNGKVARLSLAELLNMMKQGLPILNAGLDETKTKLVATTGSFSRFKNKPYVILARLVGDSDETLGYVTLDCNGCVKRFRLQALLEHCVRTEQVNKGKSDADKRVPFQNAIYVPATEGTAAFLRAYGNSVFPEERIHIAKNKHSVVKTEELQSKEGTFASLKDANMSLKDVVAEEESLYTKEQLNQLRLGIKAGLNVTYYANPEISWEKMEAIRIAMMSGVDVRVVCTPRYVIPCSLGALKYVLGIKKFGIDIAQLLNPKYSVAQLIQLHLGLIDYIDISQYADPNMSETQMETKRKELTGVYWAKDPFID